MNKKQKTKLVKFIITLIIVIVLGVFEYIAQQNGWLENILNEAETTQTTTNANIDIADIPQYAGEIVISINNDVPYFEEKDMSTEDFEYYSNLDELNRAGVAFANICKYTMPPQGTKRESLSYKPTGWVQYLYGENNSKHLYEEKFNYRYT